LRKKRKTVRGKEHKDFRGGHGRAGKAVSFHDGGKRGRKGRKTPGGTLVIKENNAEETVKKRGEIRKKSGSARVVSQVLYRESTTTT